jgi:hypothetical protein
MQQSLRTSLQAQNLQEHTVKRRMDCVVEECQEVAMQDRTAGLWESIQGFLLLHAQGSIVAKLDCTLLLTQHGILELVMPMERNTWVKLVNTWEMQVSKQVRLVNTLETQVNMQVMQVCKLEMLVSIL